MPSRLRKSGMPQAVDVPAPHRQRIFRLTRSSCAKSVSVWQFLRRRRGGLQAAASRRHSIASVRCAGAEKLRFSKRRMSRGRWPRAIWRRIYKNIHKLVKIDVSSHLTENFIDIKNDAEKIPHQIDASYVKIGWYFRKFVTNVSVNFWKWSDFDVTYVNLGWNFLSVIFDTRKIFWNLRKMHKTTIFRWILTQSSTVTPSSGPSEPLDSESLTSRLGCESSATMPLSVEEEGEPGGKIITKK